MPVRVKLKIATESDGKGIVTSALVNSGYEADEPELLIPMRLAIELGIWRGVKEEFTKTPIGMGKLYAVDERVNVEILTEDKKLKVDYVKVLISEFEDEVLISDYLTSGLKIAVEDFKDGIWRFRDEPINKLRRSEKPQYWK